MQLTLPDPPSRARRRCAAALPACAPLVVGGAAVGGAMAVDRRSIGVQIEDEAIEQRINNALAGRFGRTRSAST